MSKDTEAMKLALEALNNSVDLVVEDAYNAEKLYGNYPTRQGKVGGLKVLAEDHKKSIKALEEALAVKQEQGEPVAWLYKDTGVIVRDFRINPKDVVCLPLYTTPQQRKPLTHEQRRAIILNADTVGQAIAMVEAAHGIKE